MFYFNQDTKSMILEYLVKLFVVRILDMTKNKENTKGRPKGDSYNI